MISRTSSSCEKVKESEKVFFFELFIKKSWPNEENNQSSNSEVRIMKGVETLQLVWKMCNQTFNYPQATKLLKFYNGETEKRF